MTKICPDCKIEYSDDHGFCSQCGHKLEPKQEAPPSTLHIGDANAISGGISIDQSKTVQHHDVYYQTTQERTKTDKEIQQEQQKQYFDAVRRLMQNGVMSGEARIQLNALKSTLFIDERTAMQIEEAVKNEQKAKSSGGELKLLAKLSLDNAIKAVQDNLPNTADHIKKLAPVCRDTTNEQVHYYYYMLLSAFEPQQCVEAYEHRSVDSYWQSFWTSLAYRKLDRETEFVTLLNDLSMWKDRPETNAIVGFCVGQCLSCQGDIATCRDDIVNYLNTCNTEPSELLNDLFHALLHLTDLDQKNNPHFAFYEQQFLLAGTIAKQREAQAEKERKEREARAEKERKEKEAQAERERKEKEAQDSEAKNQYEMGEKYYYGKGVTKDFAEAAKWYRKAAESGFDRAQNTLGYMYQNGLGVPQDHAEAVKWLSRAVDQGNAAAMGWLGRAYEFGEGVRQNDLTAQYWYEKAIDQGNAYAKRALERLLSKSKSQQETQTISTPRPLSQVVSAKDHKKQGDKYYEGIGVRREFHEAAKWYRMAAEEGNAEAQNMLAYMLYNGQGVEKNLTEAFKWFSMAANQGFLSSQFWVGYLYHTGRGVAQNYAEAAKWYRKAADQGHNSAQRNLGVLYEEGKGVPQSYQEARKWYQKALDNGYADAKDDLNRIQHR